MKFEHLNYDDIGRISYTPEYHTKKGSKWLDEDIEYLINWYDKVGIEEMTFALERPQVTIMTKAVELRRKGLMKPTRAGRKRVS